MTKVNEIKPGANLCYANLYDADLRRAACLALYALTQEQKK